jgi:hypothetical protein
MPASLVSTNTITIASGTTTAAIDLGRRVLVGVQTPASIASTTLKIKVAPSTAGTYVNVYDGLGQYVTVGDFITTIASSKYIPIPPPLTAGVPYCKLEFGSTETAKTFTYYTREIE